MGERELREKYGGKLAKAINRAIRAECPGGNEALDKLTALAGPAMQSGWKERNGDPTPEAVLYFKHQRNVVDKLEVLIREKWGIPPERKPETKSRQTKPRRQRRSGGNQTGQSVSSSTEDSAAPHARRSLIRDATVRRPCHLSRGRAHA
jgi:hypothetical protein